MVRSLLLVVAATSVAAAQPASPLWQTKKACPVGYYGTTTYLAAINGGRLYRVERAGGKQLKSVNLKLTTEHAAGVAGDTLVAVGDKAVTAIDVVTGKAAWKHAYKKPAAAVHDDVFVWHGTEVERLALATGATTWKVKVPISGFQIATSPGHVFVAHTAEVKPSWTTTVIALDPSDGHAQWTTTLTGGSTADLTPAGDDLVVTLGSDDVELLDSATGKATKIASGYTWSPVGAPGRLYVILRDPDRVVAYDTHTRKQLWSFALLGDALIDRADDHAVYVVDDQDLIRALDPATGKPLWTWGIPTTLDTYAFAGVPALAYCDASTLVALDPSAPAVADATIAVDGTLRCDQCDKPPYEIRLGEIAGKTDASGKFAVKATGRGSLELAVKVGDDWVPVQSVPATHDAHLGSVKFEPPAQGD